MKIFVTGGAGQVGSTVIDKLLARGDTVVAIDNFATGRRDNLSGHKNLKLIEGSIADREIVDSAFSKFRPEVVIHTAASYKDPEDWGTDSLVNATGTAVIAKASKGHGVSRLIYFQTALCYGTKPVQQPIRLDHPINPVNSSYAISKTAGEHYVQLSGVDWVTFRLANVIGERNVSGPLPIFFERLSAGKKCFVTTARRDFCYAGDLANVVIQAVDGKGKGTYHFSSGQDVVVHITLKPTSSIQVPGRTIDVAGNPVDVVTTGRHDPCVGLRATPICEAMLAIVLMDHCLRHRGQNADVTCATPVIPAAAPR